MCSLPEAGSMDTYDITKAQFMKGLEQEGDKMLAVFEQLPQQYQLDGLDVFQDVVDRVVSKITDGRVRSVKFVPVEKNGTAADGHSEVLSSAAPVNGNSSAPEVEIKQEPEDESVAAETATGGENDGQGFLSRLQSATADREGTRQVGMLSVAADGEIRVKSEPVSDTEQEIDVGTEEFNDDDFDDDADYASANLQTIDVEEEASDKDEQPKQKKPKKKKKDGKSSKAFSCRHCDFATDVKAELEAHHSVHTGNRKFQCHECDKLFSAHSSLKRHLMAHEGAKPHVCPICSKPFIDLSSLRVHASVHTGEREYQCDQCPKRYTNSANLSRHKRVHTGEKPYQCKWCDARYRDLSSLKLHHLKHTGEKPYLCEVCNKQFKTSSDFRRHERTHTQERNYECKICKKRFVQGWHVTQHMRMHVDSRPYRCDQPECGKTYRTKATLEAHIRSHLGIKQHHCVICNKSFTTKKYLKDHQVLHTAEKPYHCDTCGQKFNQLSNLKRHQRIHSDERKFECRYCEATFKYSNAWKYHEGIHTGEMLQCKECGLEFRSQHSIRRHKCDPSQFEENIQKNALNRQKEVETPKKKAPPTARRSDRTKNKVVNYVEPLIKLERLDPDLILNDEVDLAPNDEVDIETVSDTEDDPMSFTSEETITPPTLIPRPGEYASKYAINTKPRYTVSSSDFNALLQEQISQQEKKTPTRPPDPTEFVKKFDDGTSTRKTSTKKKKDSKKPKASEKSDKKALKSKTAKKKIKQLVKPKKSNVKLGKFKVKIGKGTKKSPTAKRKTVPKTALKSKRGSSVKPKKTVVKRRRKKNTAMTESEFVYPVNMVQIIVKTEPMDYVSANGNMMYGPELGHIEPTAGLSGRAPYSVNMAATEPQSQFQFESIAQLEGLSQERMEEGEAYAGSSPQDVTDEAAIHILPSVDTVPQDVTDVEGHTLPSGDTVSQAVTSEAEADTVPSVDTLPQDVTHEAEADTLPSVDAHPQDVTHEAEAHELPSVDSVPQAVTDEAPGTHIPSSKDTIPQDVTHEAEAHALPSVDTDPEDVTDEAGVCASPPVPASSSSETRHDNDLRSDANHPLSEPVLPANSD